MGKCKQQQKSALDFDTKINMDFEPSIFVTLGQLRSEKQLKPENINQMIATLQEQLGDIHNCTYSLDYSLAIIADLRQI